MDDVTAIIISSLAMVGIILFGVIMLKIEYEKIKKRGKRNSKNSSLNSYFRKVQKNKKPPRKVHDSEISPYQGFGGKKQIQRAQPRKRTQVRHRESSIWDNLAPKEYHTALNIINTSFTYIHLDQKHNGV